jgi:hypothetical protein
VNILHTREQFLFSLSKVCSTIVKLHLNKELKASFCCEILVKREQIVNKSNLIILLIVVVIASLIIAGIILVNLGEDQVPAGELHTFPLSVEEQTYVRARLICR